MEEEGEEGRQDPPRVVLAGTVLHTRVADCNTLHSVAGSSCGVGLREYIDWPASMGVDPLACINEVGGAGSGAADNMETGGHLLRWRRVWPTGRRRRRSWRRWWRTSSGDRPVWILERRK